MYLPRDAGTTIVRRLWRCPEDGLAGHGLVEYALLLVMVALIVLAVLMILGPQIANVFSRLTSNLSSL